MTANYQISGTNDFDAYFAAHVTNNAAYATGYSVGGVDIQSRYDPLANPDKLNRASRLPASSYKTSVPSWPANTDLSSIFCGHAAQYALTNPLTVSNSSNWTSPATRVHEFTVAFSSAQALSDYFFYGGRILLSASRTGGSSTPLDIQYGTMLSNVSQVACYDVGTFSTGTTGTPSGSIGGTNLTGSYQQIFSATAGAPYGTDTYKIEAKADSSTVLRFKVSFILLTNGFVSDTMTGTLTSSINQRNHPTQTVPTFTNTITF